MAYCGGQLRLKIRALASDNVIPWGTQLNLACAAHFGYFRSSEPGRADSKSKLEVDNSPNPMRTECILTL